VSPAENPIGLACVIDRPGYDGKWLTKVHIYNYSVQKV
jgi:hypothetical protein